MPQTDRYCILLEHPRPERRLQDGGDPKICQWKQELGDTYTSYHCGDCGSLLCKMTENEVFKNVAIVSAGLLDEGFDDLKMDTELFVRQRAN